MPSSRNASRGVAVDLGPSAVSLIAMFSGAGPTRLGVNERGWIGDAVVHWAVFQIASGRVFFVAVALLVAAVILRAATSPCVRRVATWCLLVGLIGLSVSATPLPPWAYALTATSLAVGLFAHRFGKGATTASVFSVFGLVVIGLHESRYHAMPVLRVIPERQIAVIGDSITAGYGGGDSTQKWPAILRDRHRMTVQDLSRMGETAASAARQLAQRSVEAPVVIIEIGGNDYLGGGTVQGFEEGLDALLKALHKPDRQVVMFELPIPPLYEAYGRVQRNLASRYGVALIPKRVLLSVVEAAEATVDSIHLTQQGHERMASFVWALLEPAVPQNRPRRRSSRTARRPHRNKARAFFSPSDELGAGCNTGAGGHARGSRDHRGEHRRAGSSQRAVGRPGDRALRGWLGEHALHRQVGPQRIVGNDSRSVAAERQFRAVEIPVANATSRNLRPPPSSPSPARPDRGACALELRCPTTCDGG